MVQINLNAACINNVLVGTQNDQKTLNGIRFFVLVIKLR